MDHAKICQDYDPRLTNSSGKKIPKEILNRVFEHEFKNALTPKGLIDSALKIFRKGKSKQSHSFAAFVHHARPEQLQRKHVGTGIYYLPEDNDAYLRLRKREGNTKTQKPDINIRMPVESTEVNLKKGAIEVVASRYEWIGTKKFEQTVGQNIVTANIVAALSKLIIDPSKKLMKILCECCWLKIDGTVRLRSDIALANTDGRPLVIIEYKETKTHNSSTVHDADRQKQACTDLAQISYFDIWEDSRKNFEAWFPGIYKELFKQLAIQEECFHSLYIVNELRETLEDYVDAGQIMFLHNELRLKESRKKPTISLKEFLTVFLRRSCEGEQGQEVFEDIVSDIKEQVLAVKSIKRGKKLFYQDKDYCIVEKSGIVSDMLVVYGMLERITAVVSDLSSSLCDYNFVFSQLAEACLLIQNARVRTMMRERKYKLDKIKQIWKWGFNKGREDSSYFKTLRVVEGLRAVLKNVLGNDRMVKRRPDLELIDSYIQYGNLNQESLSKTRLEEQLLTAGL
jgi:hypothetical protein